MINTLRNIAVWLDDRLHLTALYPLPPAMKFLKVQAVGSMSLVARHCFVSSFRSSRARVSRLFIFHPRMKLGLASSI